MRLTKTYTEDLVKKVIKYVTNPSFKPQKSLDASIFYFCKNPEHMTSTKDEIQKKKQADEDKKRDIEWERKKLSELISLELNKIKKRDIKDKNWYFPARVSHEYLELQRENEVCKIDFKDDKFKEKVEKYLIKFDYQIPNLIKHLR